MLNSGIAVEIKHFLKIHDREKVSVCKRFMNPRNVFTEPSESYAGLNIMIVDGIREDAEEEVFDLSDAKYKLLRLAYREYFILQLMFHQM